MSSSTNTKSSDSKSEFSRSEVQSPKKGHFCSTTIRPADFDVESRHFKAKDIDLHEIDFSWAEEHPVTKLFKAGFKNFPLQLTSGTIPVCKDILPCTLDRKKQMDKLNCTAKKANDIDLKWCKPFVEVPIVFDQPFVTDESVQEESASQYKVHSLATDVVSEDHINVARIFVASTKALLDSMECDSNGLSDHNPMRHELYGKEVGRIRLGLAAGPFRVAPEHQPVTCITAIPALERTAEFLERIAKTSKEAQLGFMTLTLPIIVGEYKTKEAANRSSDTGGSTLADMLYVCTFWLRLARYIKLQLADVELVSEQRQEEILTKLRQKAKQKKHKKGSK